MSEPWVPVAHRSELAAPGSYVCLPWEIGAEVAVTNIGGIPVAFDNLCSHRGARIFPTGYGLQEPRCAYHGRLATAANVRRFDTGEFGGFIFVNAGASPGPAWDASVDRFLAEAPPLALHSSLGYTIDAHWTVCVENVLDYEHVAGVHPDTLGKLGIKPDALHLSRDGSSLHLFRTAHRRLEGLAAFFDFRASFDYAHAHFHPYAALSSTRGWTYSLQHYFPRADGKTAFFHRLYAAPSKLPVPDFFDSVQRMNARIFEEDAAVCARVPAGHGGPLGPHEERIAHFRRHAG